MGGPTHHKWVGPPIVTHGTNKGGPSSGGEMVEQCTRTHCQGGNPFRGQQINANFFCTKFFDNPSGHGRPRRKSWTSAPKSAFSRGPDGGERNFLTLGHPGVRVRNVRGKSGPKSLCLCCFFFPDHWVGGHQNPLHSDGLCSC